MIRNIQFSISSLLCGVLAIGISTGASASSEEILKGLSRPAKIIIASVNAKADADWVAFCATGAPAIQEVVTNAAMKLTEGGMIDQKSAMSAGGETAAYFFARCGEAAGAPGGKSAAEIRRELSETSRLIVAEVKSEVGADIVKFCRDSGSGIQATVTNVATLMVEDEVIDEASAYESVDELTKYYISFCTELAIKAASVRTDTHGGGGHAGSDAMLKSFSRGERMILDAANQQMGVKLNHYCKSDNGAITTVVTDVAIRLMETEKIDGAAAKTVARASAKFYPVYCRELQFMAVMNGR